MLRRLPFGKKQSENQKMALSLAFNSAINDVYSDSLRSWKKIVQTYVLENADFLLGLMPEIEFVTKAAAMQKSLSERGCTLSVPEIRPMSERTFVATDLYNPCVALKLAKDDTIVPNDVEFTKDGVSIWVCQSFFFSFFPLFKHRIYTSVQLTTLKVREQGVD